MNENERPHLFETQNFMPPRDDDNAFKSIFSGFITGCIATLTIIKLIKKD